MAKMIKCPVTGDIVERGFGNFEADLTPGVRLVVHVFEVTRKPDNTVANIEPTEVCTAAADKIRAAVAELGNKLAPKAAPKK